MPASLTETIGQATGLGYSSRLLVLRVLILPQKIFSPSRYVHREDLDSRLGSRVESGLPPMLITIATIMIHAVSYVAATTLMHLWGASIPDDHHAALEHLKASAVLYSYRLSRKLAEAYVLMPKRHWEFVVQECIDACVSLGQRPEWVLVLVLLAVVGAVFRYWVVVSVVRWETGTTTTTGAGTGTGVGTQCTSTAVRAGRACWVAIVGYLSEVVRWILRVLALLF